MRAETARRGVMLMTWVTLSLSAGIAAADGRTASGLDESVALEVAGRAALEDSPAAALVNESVALEVAGLIRAAADNAPVARIDNGLLRGEQEQGVSVYRGIPFAAPPVGDNRWRPPQPASAWQGVRDATRFGRDCMQKPLSSSASPGDERPDEDCLYLNVWQPDGAAPSPGGPPPDDNATGADAEGRPVVVWLYGGAYVNGGASSKAYDGESFARDGVIYVSFNYRLGRFGFFSHPALSDEDDDAPQGNYAVMDQIAALEWIRGNIDRFGGNPDDITLVGESAGGNSILNLMASPATEGLFQRAVVMSGGGRGLRAVRHDLHEDGPDNPSADTFGKRFADRYGIEGEDEQAREALRALPADAVTADLNMSMMYTPNRERDTYAGGPVRDGKLLLDETQNRFKQQQQRKIPLLIGSTSLDLGRADAASKTELFDTFGDNADRMRALYDPGGNANLKTLAKEIGRDRTMTEPARFIADEMQAAGQPVWRYRFSHVAAPKRSDWPGAPHATDIPYLFDRLEPAYGSGIDDSDRTTATAFHRYVVNFALTGDPNGEGLPQWPLHDSQQERILEFTQDDGPQVLRDPWWERLDMIEGRWMAAPDTERDDRT
ncbi:carboxylesterase/lipase family protein [Kushneria indalinina]|uniref:Carboxylic ester hydrolase n=1 Tax=Kushneria indalinina DSM 14324 TaxID=1122140 RepID=A0A3D9DWS1_9GAMM|nr:carboxylesterase family protein [Kushneria indalinina]REC95217.1 carboxylesterase type B [Kushneria indalinina DSM 14324]